MELCGFHSIGKLVANYFSTCGIICLGNSKLANQLFEARNKMEVFNVEKLSLVSSTDFPEFSEINYRTPIFARNYRNPHSPTTRAGKESKLT